MNIRFQHMVEKNVQVKTLITKNAAITHAQVNFNLEFFSLYIFVKESEMLMSVLLLKMPQ